MYKHSHTLALKLNLVYWLGRWLISKHNMFLLRLESWEIGDAVPV